MPIYLYECPECKSCYSIIKKIKDIETEEFCTNIQCAEVKLDRVVAKSTFKLKGDGWYEQGYTKRNNRNN